MIEKLKTLFEKSKTLIQDQKVQSSFSYSKGASEQEIEHLEASLGQQLPSEYRDLLSFTNGCCLYNFDNIDGYNFLGTENMLYYNNLNREAYEEDWNEKIIIFCQILGEGNYLGFNMHENGGYEILDCFHELSPDEWKIIPGSLNSFVEKVINANGEKYWLHD